MNAQPTCTFNIRTQYEIAYRVNRQAKHLIETGDALTLKACKAGNMGSKALEEKIYARASVQYRRAFDLLDTINYFDGHVLAAAGMCFVE